MNPVYYDTIKVCDPFSSFHVRSAGVHEGPGVVSWHSGGRPSSSHYFVGSQADNLFYLDSHHTRATILLRPPTQSSEHERGIPIRQVTPEGACVTLAITVRLRHLRPVAQAHLLFHIQLLRRLPYQNNYQQVAPPREAHTFVRILPPPAGRNCRAGRATFAWMLPRYTT